VTAGDAQALALGAVEHVDRHVEEAAVLDLERGRALGMTTS
jgi:hypothetical protein